MLQEHVTTRLDGNQSSMFLSKVRTLRDAPKTPGVRRWAEQMPQRSARLTAEGQCGVASAFFAASTLGSLAPVDVAAPRIKEHLQVHLHVVS
jgi:hypothetical protein